MTIQHFKGWQAAVILTMGLMLASCSNSEMASLSTDTQPQAIITSQVALLDHPGKLMASNCFQCHGTDGKKGVFDSLAGETANEIIEELKEMQLKNEADKAIMKVHALAYTDEQIALIADYFASMQ